MAKTLVISGADYSDSSLDVVTFSQVVPCTALSLSPDSVSFVNIGDTATIIATPTPANTTDTLSWTSSNENVATVEDGAITIHGIGTAIITATCGEITATITINQSTLRVKNLKFVSGKYPNRMSAEYPLLQLSNNTNATTVGQVLTDDGTDLRVRNGTASEIQSIRVPYGANKVRLHTTTASSSITAGLFQGDPSQRITYNTNNWPKYISSSDVNILNYQNTTAGYCVIFKCSNAITEETFDYVEFAYES